jgi:4-hydroxy-2-oxoheptanedioate aldolase
MSSVCESIDRREVVLNNITKAKLAAGGTVVGCFIRYPEPSLAEYIALLGWDFLIFDGEHGPLEPRDIEGLTRAVELRGVTPIARVTTNLPSIILRYLDTGVHGVHVPWVNTPEDVEAAVRSVKYGPRGNRGLAGVRASDWGLTESVGEYTARANRETMVIIHIETATAVDAIEKYVEIDGVDVLFMGPTDLSQSLGVPGQIDHPDVVAAMNRVAEVVVPSDKVLGLYAGTSEIVARWREKGARYFATGVDGFLKQGMREYLDRARS